MAVKAWSVLFLLVATTVSIEAVRVDDDEAQQHIPTGCEKKTGTKDCENGIFGRPHECKLHGVTHCCKNACPKDGHHAEPFAEDTQTGTGSTHNGDPMNAEKHAAQMEKKAADEKAKEAAGEQAKQAEGGDKKEGDSTNSGITQKRMMEAGELAYHKADCTHPGAPEKNDTDDGQVTGRKGKRGCAGAGKEAQQQDEEEENPADQDEEEKAKPPCQRKEGAALQQLNDDNPDPEAVKKAKAAAGRKVDEANAAKKHDKDADEEGKKAVTMHPYELNERVADIKKNHQGVWVKWADSHIPDGEILTKQAEEEVSESPEEEEQIEIQKAKASGKMHPYEVKERLEAIKKDHKGPWNKWSAHMTQVKSDYKPRS